MRTSERGVRGREVAALTALALVLLPAAAVACGVCVEDRMAAVYDHAAVRAARDRGHAVAFVALADAHGRATPGQAARAGRALRACASVDAGSVRVAPAAAAASFAYDPAQAPLDAVLARLDRALAPAGLRLDTLRVLRPAPGRAGGPRPIAIGGPTHPSSDRQVGTPGAR